MSFWQRNLDFAARCIAQFSTGPTPARVARLIMFRASIERARRANEITLLSRQDMAALVGVAQENVSRVIADFTRNKLLRKVKRDVYLCDLEAIRAVAEAS